MAIVERSGAYGVKVHRGGGRYEWVGTFRFDTYGGKRAARRAAEQAEAEAVLGRRRNAAIACDAFVERWLREYPREADATNRTYRYATRHFVRDFAGVRLGDVDRLAARRWALQQPAGNVQVVRAMFTDAVNDGLVSENPFSNLRRPQSRGRRDIEVITETELLELRDLAVVEHREYGEVFGAWIVFAAYTCMRPGEIRALEWSAIDFERNEIRVFWSIDATGRRKRPKNGKPRTIILPPPAREALRRVPRRVHQATVFTGKRGGVLTGPKLSAYWKPVRAAFGARHPDRHLEDPYELRHFGATILLEKGVSHADVAVQMGHTDGGRLVMSTYGHPSEAAARARLKKAFEMNVSALRASDANDRDGGA